MQRRGKQTILNNNKTWRLTVILLSLTLQIQSTRQILAFGIKRNKWGFHMQVLSQLLYIARCNKVFYSIFLYIYSICKEQCPAGVTSVYDEHMMVRTGNMFFIASDKRHDYLESLLKTMKNTGDGTFEKIKTYLTDKGDCTFFCFSFCALEY